MNGEKVWKQFLEADEDGNPIDEDKQASWKYLPLPVSWKSWLGKDIEWDVVDVGLNNTKVTDIFPIKKLKNLEYLDLQNTQVTKQQIDELQKL